MTIETKRCPFERPSHEKPTGLQMGKAAHAIVKLGVEKAREVLEIDQLTSNTSDIDPDPAKGWRNALLALIIDASYRSAQPQIDAELDQAVSQLRGMSDFNLFRVGLTIIKETERVFNNPSDTLLNQPTDNWIAEICHELKFSDRKLGETRLKQGALAMFSEYEYMLYCIARMHHGSLNDIPDILRRSFQPFVHPLTKVHLDDSYPIGDSIHSYYGTQPVGLNENRVVLIQGNLSHHPNVIEAVARIQRKILLPSITTGCPALLSPKMTQSRYPDPSLPPYQNALSGLYSQMTDFLEKALRQ